MAGQVSDVTVRQASTQDAASVRACLVAAFEPYRQHYTPSAFQDTVPPLHGVETRCMAMVVLVAVDRSEAVVATLAYQVLDSGEGHLRGMAVDPRFQGQGIADLLLNEAEGNLRRQGCRRATLDTTEPLERAMRFYVRHGYRPTEVVSDFFGMPLFEYAKRLD